MVNEIAFGLLSVQNTFAPLVYKMIIIRTAIQEDVIALRDLCIETFYKKWLSTNTEKDLQNYIGEYFSVEKISEEIANPKVTCLLAQSGIQLVGYTKLNRDFVEGDLQNLRPMEIQRMYVLEEFIGNGIGKQLMEKAIAISVEEKFEVMWLGVWEHNDGAVRFYKSFEFEFYGSHKFVLGEDVTTDLLMKKIL